MKLVFTVLITNIFCISYISGQINTDTLRHKKKEKMRVCIVGNYVLHERPSIELIINERSGFNRICRKDGSLYREGALEYNADSQLIKKGAFKYYYKNGKLRDTGIYENDIRVGIWKHFDKNEILKYEQNHTSLIRVYFYANSDTLGIGKMKSEIETDNFEFFNLTEHEGFWEFRDVEGRCNCAGELFSDLKHGKWFYYTYKGERKIKIKRFYRRYVASYKYDFEEMCKWR